MASFRRANIVVALTALGTLRLIVQGRLLPPFAASPPQAAPA
jgi:tellurite resistance protein